MARKLKRKRRKDKGTRANGADLLAGVGGVTLGSLVGHLLAEGAGGLVSHLRGGGSSAPPAPPEDVAAKLLRALAEQGPTSIAALMAATGVGLSPMLEALRTAREFRLVELVNEGEVVQLTPSGSHTVTVLRKDEIRAEAAKLLGP